MLGGFHDEELPVEDLREVLRKNSKALKEQLAAIPKTKETAPQRKEIGLEILRVCSELAKLNKEIGRKRSGQETCLNEYLLQVAREMLGDRWSDCLQEARLRMETRGIRRDKK